ncbi:MAG: hypothetical protein KDN19_20190 [Verrucomicrobiae bacterium]|nr:hypothetical protein [Verrucomicrobiae bacterium]
MNPLTRDIADRIARRFSYLYGEEAVPGLMRRLRMMMGRYGIGLESVSHSGARWDENETVLITYADTISTEGETPLRTLHEFLNRHAKGAIRTVHLLPFYPWSSDDGFSVIDYRKVDPRYGDWEDIERMRGDFRLMFDLVLNHCSRRSQWFRDFVVGIAPSKDYFLPTDPSLDLSEVVRPRSLPLLTKTSTRAGEKWVWTTFSADQVDLNWKNPDVLFDFFDILFLYLAKGSDILRLDAVAFLWKEIGTNCLHLPQTHEVVKLFRDLLDVVAPGTVLLTETNVPHEENMSYFGEGDEAHMVYNFALPPLLLHALLRNDGTHLTRWASGLPDFPDGQTFFNFTASHDGIGVRPLQGIVDDSERDWLVEQVKQRGGRVSTRAMPDGSNSPYELNITYLDALSEPGDPELGLTRFLCSQAVLIALRGVPALYVHSLLGTPNDQRGVEETGHNRAINRHKYRLDDLESVLADGDSKQARVFARLLGWLSRRRNHPAFHPDAPMKVLDLGPGIFAFLRHSVDGQETIACVFNLTPEPAKVKGADLHPRLAKSGEARDLLSGEAIAIGPRRTVSLPPYWGRWLLVN